ncbi:hypothetical protein ABFS83_12G057800 [Erythranthe nasuta]
MGNKSSSIFTPRIFRRRRNRTPAAEIFPEEIMEEILLRLPVKSLLKFRCVSKSWCSLISSNRFIKAHLKISIKDTNNFTRQNIISSFSPPGKILKQCSLSSLFYGIGTTNAVDIDFPNRNPNDSVRVVGSCNGLICTILNEKLIYLWNPSTRKFKKLPNADDRIKVISKYGFGFDECNEDYKVLVVVSSFCIEGGFETMVKLYSLRTNSWKRIEDLAHDRLSGSTGKFVSGKLHWVRRSGPNHSARWDIVSFDLGSEICGSVALPHYFGTCSSPSLEVLGECLCVLGHIPTIEMVVWVLKEYGVTNSWARILRVTNSWARISSVSYRRRSNLRRESPLLTPFGIGPEGKILLMIGSRFMIYNPRNNCFRPPRIMNFGGSLEPPQVYCESLVEIV